MLKINSYSTPHVRRCRFNPILKVTLTVTLSWQDSKFYLEMVLCGGLVNFFNRGWIFENIIFPLLLLQIVKLTCTLDFELNCIVSASRLDTQSGSEI